MFCQMLEEELQDQTRIVMVSEHFVALELYASPAPFSTHIYPRRHMASFGDVSAAEMNDLARMLRLTRPSSTMAWRPGLQLYHSQRSRRERWGEVLSLVSECDPAADASGRI